MSVIVLDAVVWNDVVELPIGDSIGFTPEDAVDAPRDVRDEDTATTPGRMPSATRRVEKGIDEPRRGEHEDRREKPFHGQALRLGERRERVQPDGERTSTTFLVSGNAP